MSELDDTKRKARVLHDADLHSIISRGEKAIDLVCKLEDGRSATIMLRGVDQLRSDGWHAGNIILEVDVRPLTIDDGQSIEWMYGDADWVQAGLDCPNPAEHTALKLLCEEARLRVEITPSYGCFLVAVCASVSIEFA